jgi:hypothetical protein
MPETIFLSYSRSDGEFALRLAQDLRVAGVSIWIDQMDISAGDTWDRAVEEALRKSAGILVILSQASVASRSVMDEVSYALEENKRVFPVLLERCQVPFRLRRLQYTDFTSDYSAALSKLIRALGGSGVPSPKNSAALPRFTRSKRVYLAWAVALLACILVVVGLMVSFRNSSTKSPADDLTETGAGLTSETLPVPSTIERTYHFQGPFRISRMGDYVSFNLTNAMEEGLLAGRKIRVERVSFTGYIQGESNEPFGYDSEVLIFPEYLTALPGQIAATNFGQFQQIEDIYSPSRRTLRLMIKTDSDRAVSSTQPIAWAVDLVAGSATMGELKFFRDTVLDFGDQGALIQLFLWTLWGGEHFVEFSEVELRVKFRVLR